MKPNFICVGAQKSGTTTLHDILQQHYDIYLPKQKETKFFKNDFHKGLEFYVNEYFDEVTNEKIIGEIDPEYMFYEDVPKKIYDLLGIDIKIIFLLRNPMTRAYSHYLMSKRRGYDRLSFEEAISTEEQRINQGDFEKNHLSYKTRGLYYQQISRYLKYFSHENMKVVLFEEFIKNPKELIKEILDFLGVNRNVPLNYNQKSNKAIAPKSTFLWSLIYRKEFFPRIKIILKKLIPFPEIRTMIVKIIEKHNFKEIPGEHINKETFCELSLYYKEDILKLEGLIKRDLSYWLDFDKI
ncbi:sulfotransferase [Desulfosporosinus sp. OT]|uniref:sulfotransferase domain-containing protein n=1 Tax=Desulfosporosinus sp. OT TaxID=913865 RepID=UPI000223A32B|nr:sulfotransferase [Desulfosporosinus sp. OT]EGW37828.1 sulfotransferase domain protein [Desulfosporosinus sp. OT]